MPDNNLQMPGQKGKQAGKKKPNSAENKYLIEKRLSTKKPPFRKKYKNSKIVLSFLAFYFLFFFEYQNPQSFISAYPKCQPK